MFMSGDNLHGQQPDIRYSVNVHDEDEWNKMSLKEKMEVMSPAIKRWEQDFLKKNRNTLSKKEVSILEGNELKSHEGMIYGRMYAQWKINSGFDFL
tara:strand:+ start:258 stop:545 length:288 start_codon:yes stop_codon:yes gene_type:complete